MTLDLLSRLFRQQPPISPAERALIRRRLFQGTEQTPRRVLERRMAQCGRLMLRLRRSMVALEEALIEVQVDGHD